MKSGKRIWMKTGFLAVGTMLALSGLAPYAQAAPVRISFNGSLGSGYALLTVGPDNTHAEPAGPFDPSGAQIVTGANGSFTNSTLGNVTISGVLARNFARPFDMQAGGSWHSGDLPFPASFSQLAASGTSTQDNGVITYDDLFYADGSPQTCWDYPFFGGFLDPYGVMFSLSSGGNQVGYLDLWSFGVVDPSQGVLPPFVSGLTYGMAVIQLMPDGSYAVLGGLPFATAAVPEPNFLWLFGTAVLGLFAWRRSTETRKRVSHTV